MVAGSSALLTIGELTGTSADMEGSVMSVPGHHKRNIHVREVDQTAITRRYCSLDGDAISCRSLIMLLLPFSVPFPGPFPESTILFFFDRSQYRHYCRRNGSLLPRGMPTLFLIHTVPLTCKMVTWLLRSQLNAFISHR